MNLLELSEVTFGLVLENRIPASMVKPDWFSVPYHKGIEVLQQPGASREDVAKVISSAYINDAHDAVKKWNGIGDAENFDWTKALRECYANTERGKRLEKLGKKLQNNEQVDILPLYSELGTVISGQSNGLVPLSEVDSDSYKPFKKCGYAPIDKTLGGIPSDGPIVVMGLTGVGKSRFATAIINGLLHEYPEDTAAIYTLEMNAEHWKWRSKNLFPSLRDVESRLYVSGSVKDIEELVAEITAKKVNYVVLDDMDNIVRSQDAAEYERVYRRIKEICRFMGIPVFVLCQPNRVAKIAVQNGERFLGLYDAAWSGSAENSSALFLALQTTNGLDMKSEMFPTIDTDMDYLMFWKSRDGWPADRDPSAMRGPGAVVLEHTSTWNGRPYAGKWKIWTPDGNRSIGKSKK